MDDVVVANYVRHLWDSSAFSDLTLRLRDGTELKVHKCIVSKCRFFKAACNRSQGESDRFPEDNANGMEILVRYLYGFVPEDSHGCSILRTNTSGYGWDHILEYDVYVLAQKYQLPDLASKTLAWMRELINDGFADGGIWEWGFVLAKRIYGSTEEVPEMRRELLACFREHADTMADSDYANEVKQGLLDCPGLAIDLLMAGGFDGSHGVDNDEGDDK